MRLVDWRVVAAAACVMIVEGFDLSIYGMLLPVMMTDPQLGLDTSAAGLTGSAAFIGMLLGGIAVGPVCSRLGHDRVLVAGVVLFSTSMLGTMLSPDVTVLWGTRLLAGCGLGVVLPLCIAAVRRSCRGRAIPLCFSLVTGGIPAGGVIAALAAHSAAQLGWRPLFGAGALLGVVVLPLVLVLRAPSNLMVVGRDARASVPWRRLISPAVAGSLATFCFLLSFYGLMTWLTKLMTQLDVPLSGAFQLTMLLNLGAVLGSVLLGLAASRFGALPMTVLSGVIGALCLLLVPSQLVGGATLILVVVLLGMVSPSTQNLVNSLVAEATEDPWRAGLLGFTLGVGRLGAVAAPVIGSLLLTNTPSGIGLASPPGAVFIAFAAASIGGVLFALWLGRLVSLRNSRAQQDADSRSTPLAS